MHTPPETTTVFEQVCNVDDTKEQQPPRDQGHHAALTKLEKKFAEECKACWQSETTEAILHLSL